MCITEMFLPAAVFKRYVCTVRYTEYGVVTYYVFRSSGTHRRLPSSSLRPPPLMLSFYGFYLDSRSSHQAGSTITRPEGHARNRGASFILYSRWLSTLTYHITTPSWLLAYQASSHPTSRLAYLPGRKAPPHLHQPTQL
jgi:hypothetical protein